MTRTTGSGKNLETTIRAIERSSFSVPVPSDESHQNLTSFPKTKAEPKYLVDLAGEQLNVPRANLEELMISAQEPIKTLWLAKPNRLAERLPKVLMVTLWT